MTMRRTNRRPCHSSAGEGGVGTGSLWQGQWVEFGARPRSESVPATKEGCTIKAEPADQRRLLDLQAVDTTLAQLLHKRRTLPEHTTIAALVQKRDALDEQLVEADTRVGDLELEQSKAEADLEPVRARLQRNQERIDTGAVGDPKALAAMVDEVEHVKRRIGELEDAELEVMEALEQAQAERARLRELRAGLAAELATHVAERDQQVAEIDRAGGEHTAERNQLVPLLPEPLVALYERVRAQHAGSGAAMLRQRRCTGCQIEANAADLRGYAAAAPDEVLRCEECGRILVRTAESGL